MQKPAARAIDHLVLPTAGVDTARRRLSALGFTVAPDGIHPFGTANCCVYLADGTFLEPLALRDGVAAAAAIAAGNVFVARDHVFRAMRGEEGLSAIVLASDDADADHAAFVEAGISGGDMLAFSREARDAAGNIGTASFRLAFATDAETADAFLFTCQRINVPAIDRGALERHDNGVTGMREIVVGDGADSFLRLVGRAAGKDGGETARGVVLANAVVRPANRADPSPVGDDGATMSAIVFAVDGIGRTKDALEAGGISCWSDGGRLVVPPAPGQGAVFIFEEKN
ncbi:MAG TPA: VOC family protein [Rhizobiales bacterium]|nr:VOC family protein [Hyphomicrobiales bacterium]